MQNRQLPHINWALCQKRFDIFFKRRNFFLILNKRNNIIITRAYYFLIIFAYIYEVHRHRVTQVIFFTDFFPRNNCLSKYIPRVYINETLTLTMVIWNSQHCTADVKTIISELASSSYATYLFTRTGQHVLTFKFYYYYYHFLLIENTETNSRRS